MKVVELSFKAETVLDEISKISSEQLFKGNKLIKIMHHGQEYLLRITRQGKLILTK